MSDKIDNQVLLVAQSLSDAQRANPAWLWYSEQMVSLGRWQKEPTQAPYVRADLAICLTPAHVAAAVQAEREACALAVKATPITCVVRSGDLCLKHDATATLVDAVTAIRVRGDTSALDAAIQAAEARGMERAATSIEGADPQLAAFIRARAEAQP